MTTFELSEHEQRQLAPDGELRVAVAVGPAASAVWCVRDPDTGAPVGVTVSIAKEIALRTGLQLKIVEFESSGDIVARATEGLWTLSFVPIDDERRLLLGVGPDYYEGVSTFLTRADEFHEALDVDRRGVRVCGITETATLRSAQKWAENALVSGVSSLQEAIDRFRRRDVDALAIGKETILNLLADLPGCHAVEGDFHRAGTAIVVPKHHDASHSAVSRFIEELKRDGTVRKVFDENNLSHAQVAP